MLHLVNTGDNGEKVWEKILGTQVNIKREQQ